MYEVISVRTRILAPHKEPKLGLHVVLWAFTLQVVGLFTLRVTELSRLQATLSAFMLTLKTDIEWLTSDGWHATRGS